MFRFFNRKPQVPAVKVETAVWVAKNGNLVARLTDGSHAVRVGNAIGHQTAAGEILFLGACVAGNLETVSTAVSHLDRESLDAVTALAALR